MIKSFGSLFALLALSSTLISGYDRPEGYFKHLFYDGGIGFANTRGFPGSNAIGDSLKFEYDFLATSDGPLTTRIITGNTNPLYPLDSNGILIYPDGEPRYQIVHVGGGWPEEHSPVIGPAGKNHFVSFYNKGGGYFGACGGQWFFISHLQLMDCDLTTWPAYETGVTVTDYDFMDLDPNAIGIQNPFLVDNSFSFKRDSAADSIIGGKWYMSNPEKGSEILARYHRPGTVVDNKIGYIAFKRNNYSGRAMLGSPHPEVWDHVSPDDWGLIWGMCKYTQAGVGSPSLKGILHSNMVRAMNSNLTPGFEKLGDLQYHHFKIKVPSGADSLVIVLDGGNPYPFNLYAKKGNFAFHSAIAAATDSGAKDRGAGPDKTLRITRPAPGDWYIGVELDTTVMNAPNDTFPDYYGATEVLNGIGYTIKATVDNVTASCEGDAGKLRLGAADSLVFGQVRTNLGNCIEVGKTAEFTFDLISVTRDLFLTLSAYDIDAGDEVAIFINNQFVDSLNANLADLSWSPPVAHLLPQAFLVPGCNTVRLQNKLTNNVWAVKDVIVDTVRHDSSGQLATLGHPQAGSRHPKLRAAPNPFNPVTTIHFESLVSPEELPFAKLTIHDIHGKRVADLSRGLQLSSSGITWDAGHLPNGVYLIQLRVADRVYHQRASRIK